MIVSLHMPKLHTHNTNSCTIHNSCWYICMLTQVCQGSTNSGFHWIELKEILVFWLPQCKILKSHKIYLWTCKWRAYTPQGTQCSNHHVKSFVSIWNGLIFNLGYKVFHVAIIVQYYKYKNFTCTCFEQSVNQELKSLNIQLAE